ncbi:uncharacterized protein [Dermacentor andersoni]|uniref:uncharacterized protein isoform X2 n=1 Tax=Dermacentor andersoni TaxID=34620 RepID=UPI002416F328|nr:uncharacterized protein LOC129387915 isoform X3 [Dermacentor andersoni]
MSRPGAAAAADAWRRAPSGGGARNPADHATRVLRSDWLAYSARKQPGRSHGDESHRGNQTGSDEEVQESSFLGLEAVLRMLLPPCDSEDFLDGVRKKSRSIYEDITSDYSSSPSSVTSRPSTPKQEDLRVYQGKSKQQLQVTTSGRRKRNWKCWTSPVYFLVCGSRAFPSTVPSTRSTAS